MISLWSDLETNYCYLINNETGERQRVYKTGDYIKEFDASLTGSVGYKDRVKMAKKPGYQPLKPISLDKKFTKYTPSIDKLLWYSQCPRPIKLPNLEYFKTENKSKIKQSFKKNSTQPSFFEQNSSMNSNQTQQQHYKSLLSDNEIRSISTIQNLELNDQQHFKEMSALFTSKSYDYQSFNSPPKSTLKSESIKFFEQKLKEEKQQLELFQLPQAKQQSINTKGRFPIQVKQNKDFVQEDKLIAKLLYPDVFKEKVVDQKQEELRRKINKLRETEMLQRNLKNKKLCNICCDAMQEDNELEDSPPKIKPSFSPIGTASSNLKNNSKQEQLLEVVGVDPYGLVRKTFRNFFISNEALQNQNTIYPKILPTRVIQLAVERSGMIGSDMQIIVPYCGEGQILFEVAKNKQIAHSLGFDSSYEMIANAQQKTNQLQQQNKIDFVQCQANQLNYKADILILYVNQHKDLCQKIQQEMKEILQLGKNYIFIIDVNESIDNLISKMVVHLRSIKLEQMIVSINGIHSYNILFVGRVSTTKFHSEIATFTNLLIKDNGDIDYFKESTKQLIIQLQKVIPNQKILSLILFSIRNKDESSTTLSLFLHYITNQLQVIKQEDILILFGEFYFQQYLQKTGQYHYSSISIINQTAQNEIDENIYSKRKDSYISFT